jgi:hypothetical protein
MLLNAILFQCLYMIIVDSPAGLQDEFSKKFVLENLKVHLQIIMKELSQICFDLRIN